MKLRSGGGAALSSVGHHAEILRGGPEAWNAWRKKRPSTIPHLTGVVLAASERELGGKRGAPINLKSARLQEAVFRFATLSAANLQAADLAHADLVHARLTHANLSDANFARRRARSCRSSAALSCGTPISAARRCASPRSIGADLEGADLSRADLAHARLAHANLAGANLRGAVLDYADFAGADFGSRSLRRAAAQCAEPLASQLEASPRRRGDDPAVAFAGLRAVVCGRRRTAYPPPRPRRILAAAKRGAICAGERSTARRCGSRVLFWSAPWPPPASSPRRRTTRCLPARPRHRKASSQLCPCCLRWTSKRPALGMPSAMGLEAAAPPPSLATIRRTWSVLPRPRHPHR